MEKMNRNKGKYQWRKKLGPNVLQHVETTVVAMKNLEIEQRNVDIISSLPNEILCQIISFLPLRSAVETGFLSTRWKDLWKKEFLVRHGSNIDDAFISISSFLLDFLNQFHKPRNNWGLQFNLGKDGIILAAIEFEPTKRLHLDFSNVKHEFQLHFCWLLENNFSSESQPYRGGLTRYRRQINRHPPLSTFKLKVLSLVSVSYLTSEAVSSLTKKMALLESLTIKKCHGIQSLHIIASGPRLEKFSILDCQQLQSIFVEAYNIRTFRYRGRLVRLEWGELTDLMWDTSEDYLNFYPEDMMLDCREDPACNGNDLWPNAVSDEVVRQMYRAKSLSLCRRVLQALSPLPSPVYYGSVFYQLEELWWIDYSKESYYSRALISLLKLCPRLIRLYITIDSRSCTRTSINFSGGATGPARLEDLKVVKLEGFPNKEAAIILARRLKQEFNAEPLIIAKSNNNNRVQKLVKVSKLRWEVEPQYKFIEKSVEDFNEFCPNHVHMGI